MRSPASFVQPADPGPLTYHLVPPLVRRPGQHYFGPGLSVDLFLVRVLDHHGLSGMVMSGRDGTSAGDPHVEPGSGYWSCADACTRAREDGAETMSAWRVYFYDIHTREELDCPGCKHRGPDCQGQMEGGIVGGKRYMDTTFGVYIRVGRSERTITAEDFPGRIVAAKVWWVPAADKYDPEPKPVIEWHVLVHRKQGFAGNEADKGGVKNTKLGAAARDLIPFDKIPDPEPPKPKPVVSTVTEAAKAVQKHGSAVLTVDMAKVEKAALEATKPDFQVEWWLPTIPYSVTDAINRIAAAQGSVRRAMAAHNADYNGHFVTVRWNDFRQWWITEYTWAGRNVLARGSLETALRAGLREYQRGALGTEVYAHVRSAEEAELAKGLGYQPYSKEVQTAHEATWKTDLHDLAGEAWQWEKEGIAPLVSVLLDSKDKADYEAKKEALLAERRARRSG